MVGLEVAAIEVTLDVGSIIASVAACVGAVAAAVHSKGTRKIVGRRRKGE